MRKKITTLALGILLVASVPVLAQKTPGEGDQQTKGQSSQTSGTAQPDQETDSQQSNVSGNGEQKLSQDDVVATVNGHPITVPEFKATVQQRLQQLQQQAQAQGQQLGADTIQAVRKQTLDMLIESRLVEEHAIAEGPDVQAQELKSAIDSLKEQLQAQQVTYNQFLDARGLTDKALQSRIEGSLAWQKLQQQEITQENLQTYFQENKEQFNAESFEQVPQQQLTQRYAMTLWSDIVKDKKPNANIEILMPEIIGTTNR